MNEDTQNMTNDNVTSDSSKKALKAPIQLSFSKDSPVELKNIQPPIKKKERKQNKGGIYY